jgi:plastocyanin
VTTRLLAAVAVVIWVALPPPAAHAAQHVVDVTTLGEFSPGTLVPVRILEGDRLLLVNTDYPGEQSIHDLVHAVDQPLFASTEVNTGQTSEVFGVEELEPGTYPFYCFIHPDLAGTLVVEAVPI